MSFILMLTYLFVKFLASSENHKRHSTPKSNTLNWTEMLTRQRFHNNIFWILSLRLQILLHFYQITYQRK